MQRFNKGLFDSVTSPNVLRPIGWVGMLVNTVELKRFKASLPNHFIAATKYQFSPEQRTATTIGTK